MNQLCVNYAFVSIDLSQNNGIAIAPILFAVAMLAILATALSAGSSMFSGGTSQEKASILAKTITDRAIQYRMAVQRLMAQGCSETQISFYSTGLHNSGAHTNPNAPANRRCDIFDQAGAGGLSPTITSDWGDFAAAGFNPNVLFTCGSSVNGIGTSKPEIIYRLQDISKAICDEINKIVGWNGTAPSTTSLVHYCNGSFSDSTPYPFSVVSQRMDFCYQYNATARYIFISVLLPR